MAIITNAPRGTQDVLPAASYKWQHIERVLSQTAALYGYREIRIPTFEHTELFNRSVGDTTDVVQKEMYTFNDKGNRSITLRPEGTSGVVRASLQNSLLALPLPLKAFYILSCFRYEKPQAGRLREFHQFGCECFGSPLPQNDVELIAMLAQMFDTLGLSDISLRINSIGCKSCRADYHKALTDYFTARIDDLCPTCRERLATNPMRILDCKSPECQAIAADAPKIIDFLCGECQTHFDGVKKGLDTLGIPFEIDPFIVRGLDYYTRTVFEFVTGSIGAQSTVCGGGRYDGLVEELGGAPTPALGFGMGLERLLLLMEAQNVPFGEAAPLAVYIAPMGDNASAKAAVFASALRKKGVRTETDLMGRSMKAQFKYADKLGAQYVLTIGDNELDEGKARLKRMADGEQIDVALDDRLADTIAKIVTGGDNQ